MRARPSSTGQPGVHPSALRHQAITCAPWLKMGKLTIGKLAMGSLALGAALPNLALAQASAPQVQNTRQSYDIPAGPLAPALSSLASTANVLLTFTSEQTGGKTTAGIRGQYTVQEALSVLLAQSGLQAVRMDNGGYVLRAMPASAAEPTAAPTPAPARTEGSLPPVTVVATPDPALSTLSPAYAGGQVARGGSLGLLGNRDVMDTPFNLTSYTAQTIDDQQAKTVADILQNDPSVRIGTSRLNGSEAFNIRGFAVTNAAMSVNGLYGLLPYWRGSLLGIERVEVLKGPNALLNGISPTGQVGGNVNLVTKRADDQPLTRLMANYLSDSQLGASVDIGRRFGPENSVGVRLNGAIQQGDTAYDRQSQSSREATLGIDYRGRNLRLSADLGYLQRKTRGGEGFLSLAAGATLPSAPRPATNYFQPWAFWDSEAEFGLLRGEFDFAPDWTVFAVAGARTSRENYLLPWGIGLNGQGNFTESFLLSSERYETMTGQLGLRGRIDTGPLEHRLSLTMSSFDEDKYQASVVRPSVASNIYTPNLVDSPALPGFATRPKVSTTRLSGLALADTISMLDDRLQLTLGLRHQEVDVRAFTATGAVGTQYDKSALTPGGGLVFKATRNVSLYANYIEALTQGPVAPSTAVNAGQIFAPYKSKQAEVGTKVDWGSFVTTFSVFQIRQPSSMTDPGTRVFSMNGERRNRGIEINTFGTPFRHVRVLGGLMLLDSKLTNTGNAATTGKTATGSPRINLTLGGEYDTSFLPGLTLTARAIHTSSQYFDVLNTQEIPGWTRWDFGARYTTKIGGRAVVVRANLENAFNRAYWMSANIYRGAPRTLLISATADF